MEQRRFSGKGHWYHETQSNHAQADVLPLVPEAANVEDRFLLDLALPEKILAQCGGWLTPARSLCHQLFPLTTPVTRLHTLSAYDRLSTALTVAQACGVQRLCNHYAALLAPLPGPDSSRESNRRLAQITQYARQLACTPDVIDQKALQQLDEVGLTLYDAVLINQIIGFIGFQARTVAVFQALLGYSVRWLPGHHIQPHTLPNGNVNGQPMLPAVEIRFASAHQLESLARWQAAPALQRIAPVLCHQPALLDLTGALLSQLEDETPPNHPTLAAAVELLTRSPDRFSAAQFTPLTEAGLTAASAINLLVKSAFDGWLDRLSVAICNAE
ncbi:CMD domain-containing protein [uncultured Enterobacter sp.]|uniref:CMD domain-containing protein n=1 Tax=uncultured Enterobacter sp. TaxID=238202 RepID=UPI002634C236|nr:CMD domain-containing protein [uncultured Enterobacter sp.]